MWMMRGQIEDQKGNTEAARELYNKAVSGSGLISARLSLPVSTVEKEPHLHLSMAAAFTAGGEIR